MQGCSVVDAALGAMGYGATKIYDRNLSMLVEIVTSLAQSNVSCCFYSLSSTDSRRPCEGARTSEGDETRNGRMCEQRISTSVLLKILESCTPFLVGATGHSTEVLAVVDALMTMAVNTSLFTPHLEAIQVIYRKMVYGNEGHGKNGPARALRSFVDYVSDGKDFTNLRLQPYSRLRILRLQPLCLRQDLSCLAREAMDRLLLPLDKEFCEREEWATLVICLALAPDLLIEARRLLQHGSCIRKFQYQGEAPSRGAMRLWELRAELASAVWNVINCSSVREVTAEASFPPQHAFYHTSLSPYIVILRWAPTLNGLVKLVSMLDHMENLDGSAVGSSSAETTPNPTGAFANKQEKDVLYDSSHVNHNSIWFTEHISEAASLEGLEGATFSMNGGDGQAAPRVAAKYIAWVLNPIDLNVRGCQKQMLLQCSNMWDKVMESVSGDTNPDVHFGDDPQLLQCKQSISTECDRWGISVCNVKRQKRDEADGTLGKQGDSTAICCETLSLAALDLWLTDLPRKLGAVKHGILLEASGFVDKADKIEKVRCDSRDKRAPFSQPHIDYKQIEFMANFLPLGALAESLPMCSPHIMCHLLQFVGRGGMQELRNEKDGQETRTEVLVCNSLCSKFHSKDSSLQMSERVAKTQGTQRVADGSLGNYSALENQRSANWIPGSAALFNFLDSLHDDAYRHGTALSESEVEGEMSKIHRNLAVIMSHLVREWGRASEIQSPTGVFLKGPSTERYVATLEDLRRRFGAWVGKLQLSTEVERTCDSARKALDMRIANLRSLLISS